MSKQNRYRIERNYKYKTGGWEGWVEVWSVSGDTWQDAIRKWVDYMGWIAGSYQVVSETPSEDGRSGITETQFEPGFYVGVKFKATVIED